MNKLNYEILDAIRCIDQSVSDSRESVFNEYSNIYDKQSIIIENYNDIDFENKFDIFQEAKTKNINVDGLSAFKFDNSKLLEANEAFKDVLKTLKNYEGRKVSDFRKNLSENDFLQLYNHEKFKQAIKCLEQQFDCKIKTNQFFGCIIGTATLPGITKFQFNKITLSKTQGFKMGGQTIWMLIGLEPTMFMPKDENLFGQYCCAIYLHEIFHNIYAKTHMSNVKIVATTQMFLNTLSKCCNEQQIVECCEHYTDAMYKHLKLKVSNKNKAVIVKNLAAICVKNVFKVVNENSDKDKQQFDVDDFEANDVDDKDIKEYRNRMKLFKQELAFDYTKSKIKAFIGSVLSVLSLAKGIKNVTSGGFFFQGYDIFDVLNIISTKSRIEALATSKDGKKKKTSREEYYCDLFSGMYGLPVTFRYFFRNNKVSTTANKLTEEQLKEVYNIERIIEKYDPHPSNTARNYAGVQIAKQFIDNKDVAPEMKDYCQWVIDNFSSTENLNFDDKKNYHSRLFDPEEAKDINKHLRNIALNNSKKITITEYDMSWIGDIDESEIMFE